MMEFLKRYGILIIVSCLCIYAILVKLSIVQTMDSDTINFVISGFLVVEMFRIEYKLGPKRRGIYYNLNAFR